MLRMVTSWFSSCKARSVLENPFNMQKHFFRDHDNVTIFDVGAYVGKVSEIYRKLFPNATIYCFEPFPDSFEKLKRLSADRFIKPYQIAISDHEGSAKFYVSYDPTCNSFLPRPETRVRYYPKEAENIDEIQVDTTTIDHFCSTKNISEIDILKIDVEGTELKVLDGAHDKLSEHAIALIYTEVMFVSHYEGGCLFNELSNFLERYNYTLFNLYNLKQAKNGQLRWGNAIFLSPPLRAKIKTSTSV